MAEPVAILLSHDGLHLATLGAVLYAYHSCARLVIFYGRLGQQAQELSHQRIDLSLFWDNL